MPRYVLNLKGGGRLTTRNTSNRGTTMAVGNTRAGASQHIIYYLESIEENVQKAVPGHPMSLRCLVETRGLEPLTLCLQSRCSPN